MFSRQILISNKKLVMFLLLTTRFWSVSASDENEEEEDFEEHRSADHFVSDLMTGGFFMFIIIMIGFHCYLKRQERKKFEESFKSSPVYEIYESFDDPSECNVN